MTSSSSRLLALGLILFATTAAHAQVVVTSCDADLHDGVLGADLDCSGASYGVTLSDGGTFDLAGHTLIPGPMGGIRCVNDCTIEGSGGAISGGTWNGISGGLGTRSGTITVSNLELSGNELDGISANNAIVTNCQFLDNYRGGLIVWGRKATVTDSVFVSNLVGVSSRRFADITGSTFEENVWAVEAQIGTKLTDTTISDTWRAGVRSRKLRATNSTVTNSGTNCSDNPLDCYDIGSLSKPRLEGTACGTSARLSKDTSNSSGESWSVCTLD